MTEKTTPLYMLYKSLESNPAFVRLIEYLEGEIKKEEEIFWSISEVENEREQKLKVKHYKEFLAILKQRVKNSQVPNKK